MIDSLARVRAANFAGTFLVSFLQQTSPPAHASLPPGHCPGRFTARPANWPVRPRTGMPGVQPPRTCVSVLHRRERQLAGLACRLGRSWAVPTGDQDPKARRDSGGTPPVRGRTGHAALSPSARAGGPGKTSGADARDRLDQARRKPPLQGAKRQRRHSAA